MRWIKLFGLFMFLFGSVSIAAQQQTITLLDGSSVSGQVLSLNNGIYQIKTRSMGTIQIQQNQVVSISSAPATSTYPASISINPAQFLQIQRSIASNPQMMQTIQSLQYDSQFQEVLNDPEIMQAIRSGNWAALIQNPKIQNLTNHSSVKNISRQMSQ